MKYSVYSDVTTDHLTNLNNRESLLQEINDMQVGNLILIDIDKFNTINNLYGMDAGDKVLIWTARYLEKIASNRDYKVYRIASNEFALLDYNAKLDIEDIYDDIQTILNETAKKEVHIDSINGAINIHVTIGFALSDNMILEQASTALTYAKKNYLKFSAYSNIINNAESLSNYAYWNAEINKAIEKKNIKPFFQPIFDRDENIVRHEVLMRLIQEDGDTKTSISPLMFLDIAVQTKRYNELSKIIIFDALNMLKGNKNHFSINFAYQDIKNKELLNELYQFLVQNPDVAGRCTFEILENEFIENPQLLLSFISKVRTYGVKIAIDDFGSGFSNFELILFIHPDIIKIDGTLIKNVDTDSKSLTLVEAIIAFSHKMDIKVVAEYVHSKDVYDVLKNTEIDMFQGYYFSEPVHAPKEINEQI